MEPSLEMGSLFESGLAELSISLDRAVIEAQLAYFSLLLAKNTVLNLISAKQDLKTRLSVHLLDSLSPLLLHTWPRQGRALDLGSGGGLPAIPLALACPQLAFSLAEATAKKARFLSEVQSTLNLPSLEIINRYLEPGSPAEKQKYDLITVRGVSALSRLISLAAPRLKAKGLFLAFKGPQADQEIQDANPKLAAARLQLQERLDLILPFTQARRVLLLYQKR